MHMGAADVLHSAASILLFIHPVFTDYSRYGVSTPSLLQDDGNHFANYSYLHLVPYQGLLLYLQCSRYFTGGLHYMEPPQAKDRISQVKF